MLGPASGMETQQHQEGGARAEDSMRQGSFERNEDVETTMPTEDNQDMITMFDMTSAAMAEVDMAHTGMESMLVRHRDLKLRSSNYETVAAGQAKTPTVLTREENINFE